VVVILRCSRCARDVDELWLARVKLVKPTMIELVGVRGFYKRSKKTGAIEFDDSRADLAAMFKPVGDVDRGFCRKCKDEMSRGPPVEALTVRPRAAEPAAE
jgi:hypothetical protein